MDTNTTKRRILIFSTAFYPFIGGAEIAVEEITYRLMQEGFEFDLITAKLERNLPYITQHPNITIYRVGLGIPVLDKLWLPFGGAILASKLNKTRNYFCLWGIMVTFGSGAGYVFNIFRRLIGKKKIPMILTLQEGDSEAHLKYRWLGFIALSWKLALLQTDFLTAISNFLLNRAKKNGYKGEHALIPNGVNLSIFSKEVSEDIKNKIKEDLGKRDGDVFLVTSGRLTYKNAVDDVISSLVLLPKNVSFIVIGTGEDKDRLKRQASKLGVDTRVKFLGFEMYQDIPKYLSVCDIFIRPSRSEGFGNSFVEAMASGLPVIATPVGGIPDFIYDKKTGIFCSPNNPQSIVQAVNFLLNNQELKDNIVREAKKLVIESYNWDYIATQMKTVVFDRL